MDALSDPEGTPVPPPAGPVFSRLPTLPPASPPPQLGAPPTTPSDPPPAPPPSTAQPADHGGGQAQDTAKDPPPPPRRLMPTRWLRIGVIGTSLTAWVGVFLGSAVGLVLGAIAVLALIAWSGFAVANVGRARVATVHQKPPRPIAAVLWWLAAPVVLVCGVSVLVRVRTWVDAATFEEEGTRSMILVGVVVAVVAVVLVAAYLPYSVLRRASRWVSGDSSRMLAWFLAPFIAGVVAFVLQVLAALSLVADAADGSTGGSSTTATAVLAASIGLPIVAWLIYGGRAMIDLEEATRHQHARAVRESDPTGAASGPVNPIVAGQLSPKAVGDVNAPLT